MRVEQRADTVLALAPAKVNFFLEVLGKRTDGFHELETLMIAVAWFDNLTFQDDPGDAITLTCDDPRLPLGPANLVWRAADCLRRHANIAHGVRIHLEKRIPWAAGLGGGSSDAAAALLGLCKLWKLSLPLPDLMRLGAQLGSDVAFFLAGNAAWCTGRGEIVQPIALPRTFDLVIVCPAVESATADVYRGLNVPSQAQSSAALRAALEAKAVDAVGQALFNRLREPAEALKPELRTLGQLLESVAPGRTQMTGSGSAYYALADNPEQARAWAERIRTYYPDPATRILVTTANF